MLAGLLWWKRRIEAHCLEHGLLYPWYIPVVSFGAQIICVIVALAMRNALWPVGPLYLSLLLVALPGVIQLGFGRWLPWYVDMLGGMAATVLLLTVPVTSSHLAGMDAAPALLMFLTAEATARDGIREGAAVGVLSVVVLSVAAAESAVTGLPLQILTVLLGLVMGAMLLWQARALAAERDAREQAWRQATLAERQRIAREIHDLVAHSLSVTLLHLTGARHALQDMADAQDESERRRTTAEVDSALRDAEGIGREAMADIRRTVSTLADGPSPTAPLPGGGSIRELVEQVRAAGVALEYDEVGDPSRLPDRTGLSLFRIAQESLSNAVRHAPRTPVAVRLEVSDRDARLTVRNTLPLDRKRSDGHGSGLAGMQARADELGAGLSVGPAQGDWLVDARVPLPGSRPARSCPMGLRPAPAPRPAEGLR